MFTIRNLIIAAFVAGFAAAAISYAAIKQQDHERAVAQAVAAAKADADAQAAHNALWQDTPPKQVNVPNPFPNAGKPSQ
jgi:hypothetical protein